MSPTVLVTCGVGGAGKTTTAAAFALACARAGRRVVVVTIDPARRLADALGVSLTGLDPEPVQVADLPPGACLSAVMLDRKAMWDRMVRTLAPTADAADRLLLNRYYRAVSTRLTGSHEYMAVELLHSLVQTGAWDVIVLDTPPSTHAEEFLRAPDRVRRLFDRRVITTLTGEGSGLLGSATRKALGLARRIVGDRAFDDIQEFLRLISAISEQMAAHNTSVDALLSSRRTTFYLVVTINRTPDPESSRFADHLRERGLRFGGLVANRVHVAPPELPPLVTPCPPDLDPAAWRSWCRLLERLPVAARAEAERDQAAVRRLEASGSEGVVVLPDVPGGAHSVAALEALASAARSVVP